jgi:phosphoserine phosphatase
MKTIIALAYDFDGTLTPKSMQEYTVLPKIGMKGQEFWDKVGREVDRTDGDKIITYMRMMLEASAVKNFPITKDVLHSMGKDIKYFKGVETFFKNINNYVKKNFKGVEVRHYIISAGLKEIIEASAIAKNFHNIFACEYYYDEYGRATFPNVIVNDTIKTQYIFRINKGKEAIKEDINTHMDPDKRPIPFSNIIYVGDGLTDVPCMTVVRNGGGTAIAVYDEAEGRKVSEELLQAGRVDITAKADYTAGGEIDTFVKAVIKRISQK